MITQINLDLIKKYLFLFFLILTPYFLNLINNLTYTYLQSREFRAGQNFNERTTTFFYEFKKFNLNKDYYKSKNYDRDIIFDENYYKNFVLNRLNPIKVHDNFFILKNSLSTNQINQIKIYERNKLISIFPEPFLKFLIMNLINLIIIILLLHFHIVILIQKIQTHIK